MKLPATLYQNWTCVWCFRLFVWETSTEKLVQPVIAHCWECKGDNLARIAGDGLGDHRKE